MPRYRACDRRACRNRRTGRVLQTGQAQLVTGLTPREFDRLRTQDGVSVGGVTGNENMFLHMNFAHAALR